LFNRCKEVKIVEQNRELVMMEIGIDETGALMVENETGEKERIISGEVSVRGLYGYT
ncbi:MAG: biotin--[acetyl-CoA-carboxylase] ligase, partial [Lachnospiraceae bacterium]|nr:biotin--[acetyl-CoA-carboxylase] ligase [Lachnospiraceae bacterium]